jgi:hypothetical protein
MSFKEHAILLNVAFQTSTTCFVLFRLLRFYDTCDTVIRVLIYLVCLGLASHGGADSGFLMLLTARSLCEMMSQRRAVPRIQLRRHSPEARTPFTADRRPRQQRFAVKCAAGVDRATA